MNKRKQTSNSVILLFTRHWLEPCILDRKSLYSTTSLAGWTMLPRNASSRICSLPILGCWGDGIQPSFWLRNRVCLLQFRCLVKTYMLMLLSISSRFPRVRRLHHRSRPRRQNYRARIFRKALHREWIRPIFNCEQVHRRSHRRPRWQNLRIRSPQSLRAKSWIQGEAGWSQGR